MRKRKAISTVFAGWRERERETILLYVFKDRLDSFEMFWT